MGLLDMLFGGNSSEILDKIKDFAETGAKEVNKTESYDAPFGISWGEQMPQEENQFNSGKPYDQYFYDIYTENFPTYRITCESFRSYDYECTRITFYNGEIEELDVIIRSDKDPDDVDWPTRHRCKCNGIPFLRFYYDHDGWWNTKKYVLNRTRNALGMSVLD